MDKELVMWLKFGVLVDWGVYVLGVFGDCGWL